MGLRQAVKRRLVWGGGAAAVVWLLVLAVFRGWDTADPVASVVGATAGVLALAYAATAPADAEALAAQLAREVVRAEQREYLRSLDGDTGGRIDLGFTAHAQGRVEGVLPQGTLGGLTTFYRSLRPRRMVITGGDPSDDAGTGKSLAALSLALELARDRQPDEAVPLRMAAAGWRGQDIDEWLRQRLVRSFGLRSGTARTLVDARLVLPVIDGLDELDPHGAAGPGSLAAALLGRLNSWQHGTDAAPVIVTCRRPAHDALAEAEAHLRTAAVVCLGPVDGRRAREFLSWRVADTEAGRHRWQQVMDALEPPDTTAGHGGETPPAVMGLRAVLTTPWRLFLAVTVYQERTPDGPYRRHPSDLLDLARTGTLHRYLLHHFLPSALARHRTTSVPAEMVWRWLAVLAAFLRANDGGRTMEQRTLSSTDLALTELWPIVGVERMKRGLRLSGYLIAGACELLLVTAAAVSGEWEVLVLSFCALLPLMFSHTVDLWEDDDTRYAFRPGRYLGGLVLGAAPCVALGVLLPSSDPWYFWAGGLALPFGLLAGALAAMTAVPDERYGGALAPLRRGAVFWALTLGTISAVFALWVGLTAASPWRGALVTVLLTLVFCGLLPATPLFRYFVFLLLARDLLPWRLGRFLDSCHQAGILRTAGHAYQFRHREIQEHLAAHPLFTTTAVPVPPRPSDPTSRGAAA